MIVQRIRSSLTATAAIELMHKLPLQKILGAKFGAFGLDAALAPLVGFYAGAQTSCIIYILRTAISALYANPLSAACFHLPTAAASLYLSAESRLLKLLLPLGCMIAFLIHPVGNASWVYSLYWIPPCIIGASATHSIFLRALGATLTAHGVGSTLWLYTHATEPLFWHTLIGIVWLERLTFALCMTAGYYGILYGKTLLAQTGRVQPS